ncbi:hypothetical protein D3C78_1128850 [compost metagenome]
MGDWRIRVTGDRRRRTAQLACIAQCTNHVRCPPGCCQPDHHIGSGQIQRDKVSLAQRRIILRTFHRFEQRARATGNQPDHHAMRHAEGRRTFGSIQHPKAAAGAGPQINQPSTGLQRRGRQIHRLCDGRQNFFNRLRYFAVFLVKTAHHLQRRHLVEPHGGRIAGFRD